MKTDPSGGFAMEHRLKALSPGLHRCFAGTVVALQYYLSRYKLVFPEYTDHTELHCLAVTDYCNRLIGGQISRLNADELYILLMAVYLHDSGMGITPELYREFREQIDFGDYFDVHPEKGDPDVIRDFHHEFSGLFIRKFARLFDIPSEAHLQAIVQVSRGHRRTDLADETEYPAGFPVPGGNRVCLPYLAAVIRLADEIDVTASRNPALLFDIDSLTDQRQIMINRIVRAVRRLEITEKSFVLYADTTDPQVTEQLYQVIQKMQRTLDYCRQTVLERTPYVITQEAVRMTAEQTGGETGA